MKRMRWAGVAVAWALLGSGCGDDDPKGAPAPSPDAGADAAADASADASIEAGADSSLPQEEAGPPEDSGGPEDEPPTFAGATGAEVLGERKIRVSWEPASDDHTPEAQIAYRVYRSRESGAQDFEGSKRCGTLTAQGGQGEPTDPCYITAPAGADGATFVDGVPGLDFYYVARAIDDQGQEDDNDVEVSARSTDESPPEFGGVRAVEVAGSTSISISWGEAYDKPVPADQLIYHVYVAADRQPDPDADDPILTTDPGVRSVVVGDLTPLTTYFVLVRVEDPDENVDDNTRVIGVTTPEGIAPTFDGLKFAQADGTSIRLFWIPATDNVTEPENIIYDIWESLNSRRQNFDAPPSYSTDPGVASWLITDLEPGTAYYYVVRARDAAGNRDDNTTEKSQRTGGIPDNAPPEFAGVSAIVPLTPSSLEVTWGPSNEPVEYLVYVGDAPGVDLTTPTTVTRQRTTSIIGLTPETTRYVVVRARDLAGNIDDNTRELSATTLVVPTSGSDAGADGASGTPDTAPPLWASGPPTASTGVANATVLTIAWDPAIDDYPSDELRYHVCASTVQADCLDDAFNTHVQGTTDPGVTEFTLANLTPRTEYWVFVRTEDPAGNIETANHSVLQRTATSFSENVRPIIVEKCVACHSGSESSLLGQKDVPVRDVVNYTNVIQIRDVGSGFEEAQACAVVPPDGCFLKLVDPGRPEFSLIYRKVNPFGSTITPFSAQVPNVFTGLREPRDTEHFLTVEEDAILREWIEQGAFGG